MAKDDKEIVPITAEENLEDGEFKGEFRYHGTVLVDREDEDGNVVSVMTDKPREGDRVQARTLNPDTGKLEASDQKASRPSTMPRGRK